jgi:hypothetical protein
MAVTLRDVLVKLGVEGTDDALAGVEALDESLDRFIDLGIKAVATAVALTAAMVGVAVSAAAAGDAVDKGAQQAAIGTDAYQELDFIASQLGADIDLVTKALGKQTQTLKQLREETGPAAEAAAELGLAYEDLASLPVDQQLLKTADALSKIEDPQRRLELATALYGEEMAQRLMPILSAGGEELARLGEEAHKLGLVLSEEDIAASVALTDAMDELWRMIGAVKNAIGMALIPVLLDLMGRLREWWIANGQVIRSGIDRWALVVTRAVELLTSAFVMANDVVMRTLGTWMPILVAIGGAITFAVGALAALGGLQFLVTIGSALAALSAPVLAVMAAVAVLAATLSAMAIGIATQLAATFLFFEDLFTFLRGGKSVIGDFLDEFLESEGPMGSMARVLERYVQIMARIFEVVQRLGAIMFEVFDRIGMPIVMALGAALLWLAETAFVMLAWHVENVTIPAFEFLITILDGLLFYLGLVADQLETVFALADAAAEFVGGVIGVDLTGGAGAGGGVFAGGTAGFAPSAGETLPAGGGFTIGGGGGTTANIGGNNYTINGAGLSKDETLDLIREAEDEKARATARALEGAEV